uniref:site-specific integrase n=1 Tax=Prevotella heparinolytica TaxID=28113 RepID=UPI00359F42FE
KNTGLVTADPFGSYRVRFERTDRDYLTMEEITTIYNHEFSSKRLEQVRDLFIFSCYTALSYIDVCELRQEDIRTGFDGNLWIVRKRHKTNVTATVRLLDIPKAILEKYKDKLPNGKILPVISNQKMNDYLKELGELAEINEPIRETYYKGNERIDEVTPKYALLSTHAGRRTFICNALALGIPAQVVMKWTGHSDYKAMKPYIDIADDIKANAMNKFNQL